MRTGAYVLLVAVVLALGLGPRRTFVDGRFQGAHRASTTSTPSTISSSSAGWA
jgi:hypothetical protein